MWECSKCGNVNINDEPNCVNCGLSFEKQYIEMPMEKLMSFVQKKEDYTLDTLQKVCDALLIRGRAETAAELKQYIIEKKLEEAKKADPKVRLKNLLIATGACGGIGFLLKVITGSLQQEEEYLVAQTAVRMGKMFGPSGSELDEARAYVQAVDFFGGLGGFLLLAAVALLIAFFVMRTKHGAFHAAGTPQASSAGGDVSAPQGGIVSGSDSTSLLTDGMPSTAVPAEAKIQKERNFCTQCGCELDADDVFCGRCGKKLI